MQKCRGFFCAYKYNNNFLTFCKLSLFLTKWPLFLWALSILNLNFIMLYDVGVRCQNVSRYPKKQHPKA